MDANKKSQSEKQDEKKNQSKQPIPFHRRGVNEDEQKEITNKDKGGEIENSADYISTARQDQKISREPQHHEE